MIMKNCSTTLSYSNCFVLLSHNIRKIINHIKNKNFIQYSILTIWSRICREVVFVALFFCPEQYNKILLYIYCAVLCWYCCCNAAIQTTTYTSFVLHWKHIRNKFIKSIRTKAKTKKITTQNNISYKVSYYFASYTLFFFGLYNRQFDNKFVPPYAEMYAFLHTIFKSSHFMYFSIVLFRLLVRFFFWVFGTWLAFSTTASTSMFYYLRWKKGKAPVTCIYFMVQAAKIMLGLSNTLL